MFTVPCYFVSASTLKDGGLSMRFSSQELDAKDKVDAMTHCGNFGYLLFKENEVQDKDVPRGDAYEGKTPSQRLRGVIFAYYRQVGSTEDFEVFYRRQMNGIIDRYKRVLE